MNIAIIGGGWVGCHLALKLKNNHKVTLYEKNKTLFEETSYNNQNRLHLGFHYSRNFKTRKLCLNTFDRFLKDYSFLTKELPKNLYCIPENESIIDLEITRGSS
jgi:L-2-hydroxyglutarate oxidase LhgO